MHTRNKNHPLPRTLSLLALAIAIGALAACELGPNYSRPALNVPAAFGGATQPASTSPVTAAPATLPALIPPGGNWWILFGDNDLIRLEDAAIAHNPSLDAAMASVEEARAAAREVKSEFSPQISFNPATQVQVHGKGKATTPTDIPFDLSYEVDIWGQIKRSVESANAATRATKDAWGVVLLTLEADVAQDYLNLRSLENQDNIFTQNVTDDQKQLDLTKTQLKAGLVGQIDVAQAQTLLDSLVTQQEEIRRQRADAEHALAILTGLPPSEFSLPIRPGPAVAPEIPPGLPVEILRHRPDVAEAEQNLIAANANIGVAITQFYPAVSLTGAAGYESVNIQNAVDWQNAILALGPSVTFPIFTGGKLTANLDQTKARFNELVADYKSTLLTAFNDVETSLTDVHMYARELAAAHQATADALEYRRLSLLEYQKGIESYLQVLDADRSLLTDELSEAQILNSRLTATVLLIKAIGGGWDSKTPLKTPTATNLPPETAPATVPATTAPINALPPTTPARETAP